DESREQCTGNYILFKNEVTVTKDIVIIRLVLFSSQDDKMVKAIRKFNICTIPTTKVLIARQTYKLMNAIFHSGLCIEDGHYTSICREGMSSNWIEADDAQILTVADRSSNRVSRVPALCPLRAQLFKSINESVACYCPRCTQIITELQAPYSVSALGVAKLHTVL
ncbi:hypothetical protein X777_12294, partial [Ooceraea biroi]